MKKKYLFTLIALCMTACAFSATACKGKDSGEDSVSQSESSIQQEEETVESLQFTDGKIEMLLGETKQLSLSNLDVGETVTYTSNDSNVLTVSDSGVIEAKGIGSAVVKAMGSSGRSGLIQITVYDPESYPVPYLSLGNNDISLFVGDNFAVSYTYSYLGQSFEATVTMTSDNTAVAVVENGIIRAVGVGTANVLVKATATYGEVARTIKVTVLEDQIEFYPSFLGKDVYMGSPMDLTMYVNENGMVKTIDNATFTVADVSVAKVENGQLVPLLGGDTMITCAFTYNGESYEKALPIHIYGLHTCSFTFIDGTVDSTIDALYGDVIPLQLDNEDGNPEYNKAIKCWYVNGERVTEEYFEMPDEDVEVSVRFVNETEDNFEKSFTEGSLVNNTQAKVEYVNGVFTDEAGNNSDYGYVKLYTTTYGSAMYNFEEVVTINEYASIRVRLCVGEDAPLLYFGIPNTTMWPENGDENYDELYALKQKDKRYEASSCGHGSGNVPVVALPNREWAILEMPLTAFGNVGDKLNGISIAVASPQGVGSLLIDFISVNYGLASTDVGYQEKTYYDAIFAADTGSDAQVAAITSYYQWSLKLSDEDRNDDTHQAHVAEIRTLIETAFTQTHKYTNDPIFVGGTDSGNNIDQGATGFKTDYKSHTYERFHVLQFNKGDYDGTITLSKLNYNACQEVYFGMYTIAAYINDNIDTPSTGKISIYGQTFTYSSTTGEHYFKVWIKNGTLTLLDDSKDGKDGGGVIFTVTLPEAVANGYENLQITGDFEAWAKIDITEMYAIECKVVASLTNVPTITGDGAHYRGDPSVVTWANIHEESCKTTYTNYYMTQFDDAENDGTMTFKAINYNACSEASFGIFANTSGGGVIWIGDQSYAVNNSKVHWFKVVIRDGILTLTDDSKDNNDGGETVLTVELSDEILSGEEALSIYFNFTGWSQGESTDMYLTISPANII